MTSPWGSLGLDSRLVDQILKAGFTEPTPVQSQAIPVAMEGKDLVVSAQTGTGKTAAFSLPLLERVKDRAGTFGLVLAPSREIALQTKTVLDSFSPSLGVRSLALIGGIDISIDEHGLKTHPQILVATPGRLCDHLERGNVWLEYLEAVVLDEADRMLDMGFSDQLNRIMRQTPDTRQTMLFSATMPPSVEKLAQKILNEPVRITVGKPVTPAISVDQQFLFVEEDVKVAELFKILRSETGTLIIFTRSKDRAERLWRALRNKGFRDVTQLHSNLEQKDRELALEDFKTGRYRALIATDVVGRGIHVDEVAHVVNFDFPREAADYIHRIGRTGRAGLLGKATSFITRQDRQGLKDLEAFLGHAVGKSPKAPAAVPPKNNKVITLTKPETK